MTNERIAEIKIQLDSLEEDDNPWYEAHTSYMRELVTYIEGLEQRLAKMQTVAFTAQEMAKEIAEAICSKTSDCDHCHLELATAEYKHDV